MFKHFLTAVALLSTTFATDYVTRDELNSILDSKVKISGLAEVRYADYGSKSANHDAFSFNHARLDAELTNDNFKVFVGSLWDEATNAWDVEEAFIKWEGHKILNFTVGKMVNGSYFNDRRYITDHLGIRAPQLNGQFIPVFTTGLKVDGDISRLNYALTYGNGKDAGNGVDNNDAKSKLAKVTWKLGKNRFNLWLSGQFYQDNHDVNAAGVTLRTVDYEAQMYEAGFRLGFVDVISAYAKSEIKDPIAGTTEQDSWYIQPSIKFGHNDKMNFFVRWEDFGIDNVVAATDRELKVFGIDWKLSDNVVAKVEFTHEDFDLSTIVDNEDLMFSLSMRF